jgi:HTH-type transcriptional regulator, glycine betaine synthesis regulator
MDESASAFALPANIRLAQDQFIATWGKMGAAWGISRTMAEVHALLYISGEPLCTDDIMERLQISRGNASMSLRALLDWGVANRVHKRGDRKEYFAAEQDVWTMFRAIVRQRLKLEVDPMLASLYEIRDMTESLGSKGRGGTSGEQRELLKQHNARLEGMLEFFKIMDKLSHSFVSPSGKGLQSAATLLARVV